MHFFTSFFVLFVFVLFLFVCFFVRLPSVLYLLLFLVLFCFSLPAPDVVVFPSLFLLFVFTLSFLASRTLNAIQHSPSQKKLRHAVICEAAYSGRTNEGRIG